MRLAWICVVATVGACGHGKGGGGGNAAATLDQSARQTCGKAFDCMSSFPSDAGFQFSEVFGTSEPACVANLEQSLDPADLQDSVDAGRVLFDASDAQTCLAFFTGLSCTDFWDVELGRSTTLTPPSACDTAFVGTVANGGLCTTPLDCSDGFCDDTSMTCM